MTTHGDDPLDRYLAGEIPLEELPEHLRADEVQLRESLGLLREEVRAPVGFKSDVMRAIAASEADAPAWRRLVDWWLRPQPLRIRPAVGALALAAAAALVFVVRPAVEAPVAPTQVAANTEAVTRFVLVAPEATSVQLTGDFVAWSAEGIMLDDPRGTGVWTTDVALPPGVYQYTFVVNGTDWVPDPRAVSQVDDGFGQMNSVVIVPGGEV